MSEAKAKEIPLSLQNNIKCSAMVVETTVVKDGPTFFVIRNMKGEVAKYCSNSGQVAQFFEGLVKIAEDE